MSLALQDHFIFARVASDFEIIDRSVRTAIVFCLLASALAVIGLCIWINPEFIRSGEALFLAGTTRTIIKDVRRGDAQCLSLFQLWKSKEKSAFSDLFLR